MKWQEKKPVKPKAVKLGDVRIREGFLWLPKAPDNFTNRYPREWRWLEYAVWEEMFRPVIYESGLKDSHRGPVTGKWTMSQWLSEKPDKKKK